MLVDHNLIFAWNKAVSAAAASDKVVDLEQVFPSSGVSRLLSAAFAVAGDVKGTIQFKLQDSDDGSTFADLAAGPTLTAPIAGTVYQMPVPYEHKRYLRAYFGGAPTGGTVTAFLTWGRQIYTPAAQAESVATAPVSEAAS